MAKVIVLGIDGATFAVLGPWARRGRLPNLARLLQGGTHSIMRSTIPPYSAQAWVSMMTGKSPAKHGIVDFFQPVVRPSAGRDAGSPAKRDASGVRHSFVSSARIQGEAIWDTLSRHGKRVGVVNVPLTYPPAQVNGYMVSGFMTPKGRQDYTYPAELRQEILAVTGAYDPDPWDLLTPSQSLPELAHWMDIAEQAARYLLERHPVDFYVSVIQALDQLQHTLWDVIADESARQGPRGAQLWPWVERCYQKMDAIIGQRLGLLDEDTTLFVVSDHGFQKVNSWFYVNRWLADAGFLCFAEDRRGRGGTVLAKLGLTRDGIKTLIQKVDVLGLRRYVGRFTRAAIADKLEDALSPPIDWTRSVAYSGSRTSEGIFINLKGREPQGIVEPGAAYEQVRERIMRALSALVDPRTGERVVSAVYRREDVHNGEFLHLLPDVLFSLDDRPYLTSDSTTAMRAFAPLSRDDVRGRHHSHGVFAACGAGVVPGLELPEVAIVDVAPTILYAMDLPIPADMDGRVLEEAFTPEYRRSHPIRYEAPPAGAAREAGPEPVYSDEEDAEMQRRLRGLGYLG